MQEQKRRISCAAFQDIQRQGLYSDLHISPKVLRYPHVRRFQLSG
jgi:hypothetical protein